MNQLFIFESVFLDYLELCCVFCARLVQQSWDLRELLLIYIERDFMFI